MEVVYASAPDELAARAGQLAWHHHQAGHHTQAVSYYLQAGTDALRLGIYDEAERLFQSGLDLIAAAPTLELDLLLGLGSALMATRGNASRETEAVMHRVLPLCQSPELWSQQLQVTWHLWQAHFQRDECDAASIWTKRCADLAETPGLRDEQYRLAAVQPQSATLYRMGNFTAASRCLSAVLPLARSVGAGELMYQVGTEPGVACLVNEALVRWYLGKPDQAEQLIQEGIAWARRIGQPFSLAFAMTFATTLSQRANDGVATAARAAIALTQCQQWGITLFAGIAALHHGWALAVQGNCEAGLREAEAGLAEVIATGTQHVRFSAILADAYAHCGRVDDAITIVNQVLAWIEQSGEREWEAELHRLCGDLLLRKVPQPNALREAEVCYQQAMAVARAQQAWLLHLRAAVSLGRLWRQEGRHAAAHDVVAASLAYFDGKTSCPDIEVARTFLARAPKR